MCSMTYTRDFFAAVVYQAVMHQAGDGAYKSDMRLCKKKHKTTDFRKERLGDGNLITGETAETEAR